MKNKMNIKVRSFITIGMAFILLMAVLPTYSFAEQKELSQIKIVTKGDVVLVPLREVSEKLGHTVSWDKEMRSAKVTRDKMIYIVKPGTDQLIVTSEGTQGTAVITSAPAELIDGITYVPVDMMEIIAGKKIEAKENKLILSDKE